MIFLSDKEIVCKFYETFHSVRINLHAYPDESGVVALMIRFYDEFQYVVTFLANFVPFSSNLLKNLQVFLFTLKQPDRHIMGINIL